jgi:hypothetical protein
LRACCRCPLSGCNVPRRADLQHGNSLRRGLLKGAIGPLYSGMSHAVLDTRVEPRGAHRMGKGVSRPLHDRRRQQLGPPRHAAHLRCQLQPRRLLASQGPVGRRVART